MSAVSYTACIIIGLLFSLHFFSQDVVRYGFLYREYSASVSTSYLIAEQIIHHSGMMLEDKRLFVNSQWHWFIGSFYYALEDLTEKTLVNIVSNKEEKNNILELSRGAERLKMYFICQYPTFKYDEEEYTLRCQSDVVQYTQYTTHPPLLLYSAVNFTDRVSLYYVE